MSRPKPTWRRYWLTAVLLAVALTGVLWLSRTWELQTPLGTCVVKLGLSLSDVNSNCGSPEQKGDQPKVVNGLFDWTVCSAPCEKRGVHILFYNCSSRIAVVKSFKPDEYQGCIFPEPRR